MNGVEFIPFFITAKSTVTLTFNANSRGFIVTSAASNNCKTMAIYNGTATTATAGEAYNPASAVTYTVADNTIQIVSTSSAAVYGLIVVFNGTAPSIS